MTDDTYAKEHILFVDDEPNVLESYRRTLRGQFSISTAVGGAAALELLRKTGPVTVIVSDFKMPHMDGITLLSKVNELYPDTIRMILTGYADLDMAIKAVNQGVIFRFLTKPCASSDLSRAVGAGIEQYRMTQATRDLAIVRRMKEGLEGTLRAFTRLVEYRDPYTAGHMDRVAGISTLIATELDIDSDRIQGLHLAGTVHDIGKVAIPSSILNKPGFLSEAEFAIIKTHPAIGAEIFRTLETDWPIMQIVEQHHERIDGSGYPHGLYGDEILQEAKILAVADLIDAVMTDRPYRLTLGKKETIKILQSTRNITLDAAAVDIGIKLLQKDMITGDPISENDSWMHQSS